MRYKTLVEKGGNNTMADSCEVVVDVWGDFAQFTRPDSKVERMTYNFPTPSACRGILNAIYSKPVEFYYEITQIDIMNPIRTISLKRNEIQDVANPSKVYDSDYQINPDKCRTQRMCTYLTDVYYRIHAKIIKRDDASDGINIKSLESQFNKRVKNGKCFFQPALGTRECVCYFSFPDNSRVPIHVDADFGVTLYDVFDIRNNVPLDTRKKAQSAGKTCKPMVSFFDAKMRDGIIKVPSWDSDELLVRRTM